MAELPKTGASDVARADADAKMRHTEPCVQAPGMLKRRWP